MTVPERALARIELAAVERNCRHLRSRLRRGAELCPVVKADGYGHGAVWCAQAAVAGGASWLAVATAEEAAELRRHGIGARLLVMGAFGGSSLMRLLAGSTTHVLLRDSRVPVFIHR